MGEQGHGKQVLLLDIGGGDEGHRAEYYALLDRLLGIERKRDWRAAIRDSRPVLVPQIEDSLAIYAGVALCRAVLGRRTAGILLRPLPTIEGRGGRMLVKRLVLGLLRRIAPVSTLTILPFSVEPRFAGVARDWIYDPQFWDLHYPQPVAGQGQRGMLAGQIREQAQGRRVCCAIGRQDHDKGFDQFARLYSGNADLRAAALFVSGGKVSGALEADCAAVQAAGALVLDRFISNEELFDLYASADLIWCSYAPDYDQASGIFGRAMQLGIPVVVRDGSLIHRFCRMEGLAHIALSGATPDVSAFAAPPPADDAAHAAHRARQFAQESLGRLRRALGLPTLSPDA